MIAIHGYSVRRTRMGSTEAARLAGRKQAKIAAASRTTATDMKAAKSSGWLEMVPGGFITNVATVRQLMDDSLLVERLLSILANLFGGLALLLATVGLYGIISFTVIRRTREIGVRIALGAQRSAVLWMVLRKTIGLAAIGLALGIPLVFLTKRYVESELFDLHKQDPLAIAGAALALTSVVLAAGIWPAWRGSRLDPMISLRQE